MEYKWIPTWRDKEAVTSDQVVYIISCQGFCAHKEWLYPEFQFTATDFMSMAAKSSNLGDKMSEANLQMDGQVEKPAKEQWAGGRQKKRTVPHITHRCGPLSRGHC